MTVWVTIKQVQLFFRLLLIVVLFTLPVSCELIDPPTLPEVTTKEATIASFGPNKCILSGGTLISNGGAQVSSYGVCWSFNPMPTIADNLDSETTGSESFESVIFGLSSLTTYYIRAYATNKVGTAYGEQVSITTPCVTYIGTALIIEKPAPKDGAILQSLDTWLRWENTYGFDVRYDIYFGNKANPDSIIATGYSSTSIKLEELRANTTYYWKLFAQDVGLACNNFTSPVWSFSTVKDLTSPPVSIVFDTSYLIYTDIYLVLNANVSSDGGYPVVERGIFFGTNTDPELTGMKLVSGSGTGNFRKVISGLSPNTVYYSKAYAINKLGTTLSPLVSIKTVDKTNEQTITDIDGNFYNTVKLGSQTWMAEDLKTTKYNDGTPIPLASRGDPPTPAYTNIKDPSTRDTSNFKIYGKLYNWFTVDTENSKNVCPAGWHVPTDGEWKALENFLIANGYNCDGSFTENKIAQSLSATGFWEVAFQQCSPGNINSPASPNKSGFKALPGGKGMFSDYMVMVGSGITWWSSTPSNILDTYYLAPTAYYRSLYYNDQSLKSSTESRRMYMYIRCLKNEE